jgi:hypothetical protein
MKKLFAYIFIASAAMIGVSCQEDLEPGGTKAQDMAGEWWVTYQIQSSPNVFEDVGGGYYKLMTYNTASDTEEIWIDDLAHFGPFKIKSPAQTSDLTFSATGATSVVPYDEDDDGNPLFLGITLNNGKVLTGEGLSISGVKTDSIYMEVEFDVDPGTIYYVSGHRRTGFLEDELE